MPTFIGVQCFHCSTMQVKQQKKSSNKWSCVVCNEKQSVRKVFAESVAAKDIRLFVQNFNMSRQLSEQKQYISEEELQTSDSQSNNPPNVTTKKRTDWTEYINDDDTDEVSGKVLQDEKLTEGDGSYPLVVTEMPKPLFKKPKLKDYSSNKHGNTDKLFKPLFPSRSNANKRLGKDQPKADLQLMNEFGQPSCERGAKAKTSDVTKWSHFRTQGQDQNSNFAQQTSANRTVHVVGEDTSHPTRLANRPVSKCNSFITEEDDYDLQRDQDSRLAARPVSKWNNFITEEDDNYDSQRDRDSWDFGSRDTNEVLVSLMNDQRVEDDVHPDFL